MSSPWTDERLAANGLPVRDNFGAWFADSKAVEASGAPLMLFHGTADDFNAFSLDHSFDGGFHFGTSGAANLRLKYIGGKDMADFEPDYPPRILPVYLSIQNPLRLDHDPYSEDVWGEVIYQAQKDGHDGIVYKNEYEGGESWVAFHPWQIKSALSNSGLFLRSSAEIDDLADSRKLLLARQAAALIEAIAEPSTARLQAR